jgi:hypothetical protein
MAGAMAVAEKKNGRTMAETNPSQPKVRVMTKNSR